VLCGVVQTECLPLLRTQKSYSVWEQEYALSKMDDKEFKNPYDKCYIRVKRPKDQAGSRSRSRGRRSSRTRSRSRSRSRSKGRSDRDRDRRSSRRRCRPRPTTAFPVYAAHSVARHWRIPMPCWLIMWFQGVHFPPFGWVGVR
jgi:hypothetical protein